MPYYSETFYLKGLNKGNLWCLGATYSAIIIPGFADIISQYELGQLMGGN